VLRGLHLSGETGDPAQPPAANRGISHLPATTKLKIKSKRKVRRKSGTQNYTHSSLTASIFELGIWRPQMSPENHDNLWHCHVAEMDFAGAYNSYTGAVTQA
jgi:hypothetical protein